MRVEQLNDDEYERFFYLMWVKMFIYFQFIEVMITIINILVINFIIAHFIKYSAFIKITTVKLEFIITTINILFL